jgi:hypothetical protein
MNNQFPTDPKISEILNMMKNVKQSILLEKAFHQCNVQITNEMIINMSHQDIEVIVKQQMKDRIAQSILDSIDIHTYVDDGNLSKNTITYVNEFMLFSKQEMTSIIEYIIRQMSDEDLKRIRNTN